MNLQYLAVINNSQIIKRTPSKLYSDHVVLHYMKGLYHPLSGENWSILHNTFCENYSIDDNIRFMVYIKTFSQYKYHGTRTVWLSRFHNYCPTLEQILCRSRIHSFCWSGISGRMPLAPVRIVDLTS